MFSSYNRSLRKKNNILKNSNLFTVGDIHTMSMTPLITIQTLYKRNVEIHRGERNCYGFVNVPMYEG